MANALCRRAGRLFRKAQQAESLRFFSTAGSSGSDEPYIAVSSHDSGTRTVWPDETMGPFGPQDKRFQLPGNVGFDCHLGGTAGQWTGPAHRTVPDILTVPITSERHEFVLAQFISEYQTKEASAWTQNVTKAEDYFTNADVECLMHSCSELLKQELGLSFPELPISAITVITVKQKRAAIEPEGPNQKQQLDNFINGAKEICFLLWREGYWADFIDPLTGRAVSTDAVFTVCEFFGVQSEDSALQTHPRHQSGFHIEDFASCRVTVHLRNDEPTFTGTLVTNAPSSSSIIERLKGNAAEQEQAWQL